MGNSHWEGKANENKNVKENENIDLQYGNSIFGEGEILGLKLVE